MRSELPAEAAVVSSIVTVTVDVPSGMDAVDVDGAVPPATALEGAVTERLLTVVVEMVPLLTTAAVAAVTPVAGRVPCGVPVTVVVPAGLPVVVSVKFAVPVARLAELSDAADRVSSVLSLRATESTTAGCVVLPAASLRVAVSVAVAPTRTVCVAGVSVRDVGAPVVVNEKVTVSAPLESLAV